MSALPFHSAAVHVAPLVRSVGRRLHIAYLYMLLRSAERGVEQRRKGIDGMRAAIKDDEAQNKLDGEFVTELGRRIDRLERTR